MAERDDITLSILVVDDDPKIRSSVTKFLSAQGHHVHQAGDGAEGLGVLKAQDIDIVITDVKMPRMDGFDVLRAAKAISPGTEVIMVTGFNDIENAFRAMREGAFDFFTKPFQVEALDASLRRTVRFQAVQREKDRVQAQLDQVQSSAREQYGLQAMVGDSEGLQDVRALIGQVCQTDNTTVLIQGETGSGKELVAQAIHYESARANGPFVAVDCTAIPEHLIESALFGHVKGAFTDAREARKGHFEQANGGTLFLDEIGDMDVQMQARLLRALESRSIRPVGGSEEIPIDVRVVSATHQNLLEAISEGRFREDLFYRLNTFTVRMPPLRERGEDVVLLAEHLLNRFAREQNKSVSGFDDDARVLLLDHDFPGNVRELRNMVERAVIVCQGELIGPEHLEFVSPISSQTQSPVGEPQGFFGSVPTDDLKLDVFERELVCEALRRCAGNQVRAAEVLGITRTVLRHRMKLYDISPSEYDM